MEMVPHPGLKKPGNQDNSGKTETPNRESISSLPRPLLCFTNSGCSLLTLHTFSWANHKWVYTNTILYSLGYEGMDWWFGTRYNKLNLSDAVRKHNPELILWFRLIPFQNTYDWDHSTGARCTCMPNQTFPNSVWRVCNLGWVKRLIRRKVS